jgi:hypothetical protein
MALQQMLFVSVVTFFFWDQLKVTVLLPNYLSAELCFFMSVRRLLMLIKY